MIESNKSYDEFSLQDNASNSFECCNKCSQINLDFLQEINRGAFKENLDNRQNRAMKSINMINSKEHVLIAKME